MNIDLKNITVLELVEGHIDRAEEGVRGYGGRLNIRPAYQREFIHEDKQRWRGHPHLAQGVQTDT